MTTFKELKDRKVVQWALAYLAGAWVSLQLVAILADQFGWPGWVPQGVTLALVFGFFLALVFAWYHGEKGRQRVSGPEVLMVAGILVVAGAAIALVTGERGGQTPAASEADSEASPVPERSIAVLPLDNHSPAEEHAYFAGAMTEEITSALSKVPELRVTSRSTASKFPDSRQSLREFVREVGVAHVLEGSVRRMGEEVRITVQLIDARTDEHLWSETYERELTDVLSVQVEIARRVADRLAATFTNQERRRILAGSTDDPVAYDLFLRASGLSEQQFTRDRTERQIDLLRRAVERDPDFGLAWGELGGWYYFQRVFTADDVWSDSLRMALDRAIARTEAPSMKLKYRAWKVWGLTNDLTGVREAIGLLREAVDANPSSVPVLVNLSDAHWTVGDLPESVRWRHRAAELDPLNARLWSDLAWLYMTVELDEQAGRAITRSMESSEETLAPWEALSELRMLQGRYREALAAVDSARARGWPEAPLDEGEVRLWAGDLEAAHIAFEAAPEGLVEDNYWFILPRAHVHLLESDTTRARALLSRAESLIKRAPTNPLMKYIELGIPAVLGNLPAARRAMGQYVDEGGRDARWIEQSPIFAQVRGDEVFRTTLAELRRIVARQRREIERDLPTED